MSISRQKEGIHLQVTYYEYILESKRHVKTETFTSLL